MEFLERHTATIQDISDFELMIGENLPTEYKQFLTDEGGGELKDPYCFKMTKPGDLNNRELVNWEGLGHLSSFDAQGIYDLPTHYKYMSSNVREFPYIPSDMIIIGGCGSSYVLLGIRGTNRGKVFFWHNNLFHGDENGDETYENISYVSENFNNFLESLYLDE